MQSSPTPSHRVGHHITITSPPGGGGGRGGGGGGEHGDGLDGDMGGMDLGYRLNRRRSTTTTVTTTTTGGMESSSDHENGHRPSKLQGHFLADIRPSSRRFLGTDEFYYSNHSSSNINNHDDDTSGGGGGGAGVEYAVLVPDSFAVVD